MAILFDASSTGVTSAGVTAGTFSHVCSGQNRILFSAVIDQAADTTTNVTYAGSTMTQVNKVLHTGDNYELYLYYILSPDIGTNKVISTRTGTAGLIGYRGASYQNVAGTDVNGTQYSSGTSTIMTIVTTADNCWAVLTADVSAGSAAAGTNATQIEGGAFAIFDNSDVDKIPLGTFNMGYTMQSVTNNASIISAFTPSPSVTSGLQSKYW